MFDVIGKLSDMKLIQQLAIAIWQLFEQISSRQYCNFDVKSATL